MKAVSKILSLLLVCALLYCFTACALVNQEESSTVSESSASESSQESSEEPSSQAPSEPESEAQESGESSQVVAAQVKGEGESGELPGVEGSPEFLEKFEGNDIDNYYLTEIAKASSVTEMVSVTNQAAQYWESQMNTTYDQLMAAVEEDADAKEQISTEQTAWVNDINITVEEIKEGATDGSLANVEISYGILLMYRGRCVTLLSQLYNYTGEISIQLASSEAVG